MLNGDFWKNIAHGELFLSSKSPFIGTPCSFSSANVTNSTFRKSRQSLCLRCCYSVPNGDASRLTSSLVLFQLLQRYNVTCFTNIILVLPSSHYVVINIIFAFVVPLLFTRIRCHLSLFAIISLLPQHESEKNC